VSVVLPLSRPFSERTTKSWRAPVFSKTLDELEHMCYDGMSQRTQRTVVRLAQFAYRGRGVTMSSTVKSFPRRWVLEGVPKVGFYEGASAAPKISACRG
jgi:hypothetical protein